MYDALAVKNLRKRLGMSQKKFADFYSISLATVKRWELGLWVPSPMFQVYLTLIDKQTIVVDKVIEQMKRKETVTVRLVGL